MKFTLDRPRADQYSTEMIIKELRRVAGVYNRRFSRREFDQKATLCKGSVVLSRFGTWQGALDAAGLQLTTVQKDRSQISNDELFQELGRIWSLLGHRPSKDEWEKCEGKYSYTTYKTRFTGWVNACAAFIEHVSEQQGHPSGVQKTLDVAGVSAPTAIVVQPGDRRNIPMKLRYKVLTRDRYRCVLCGRSPATHVGVSLHVDHIDPFSGKGRTVLNNLRTLCMDCNWGKGKDKEELPNQ